MPMGKRLYLPVDGVNQLATVSHQEVIDIHDLLLPMPQREKIVQGLLNLLPGNLLSSSPALFLLAFQMQQLVQDLFAHAVDRFFNGWILTIQRAGQ